MDSTREKERMTTTEPEKTLTGSSERPAPTTIVEALARVMEELPGIGKTDHSEQGYNYRGIEAITRHAQGLFGKYGVVPVARVVERKTVDLTINGRPWTQEELSVVYRLYGPSHGKVRERRVVVTDANGGQEWVTVDEVVEDWIDVGPLVGLGRDNSDKGANKSMTQAFKYALIQTLVIGDQKDDPDAGPAHEADAKQQDVDPEHAAWVAARTELQQRIASLSPQARDKLREFCDTHVDEKGNADPIPRVVSKLTDEQLVAITDWLDKQSMATDDPVEQVIRHVRGMDIADVDDALRKRGGRASGTEDSRRRRLAEAMVQELEAAAQTPLPAAEEPPTE